MRPCWFCLDAVIRPCHCCSERSVGPGCVHRGACAPGLPIFLESDHNLHMKCSLGISNFLEEISSLSHSIVYLYFFALITEEGFLISPCYSLELGGKNTQKNYIKNMFMTQIITMV